MTNDYSDFLYISKITSELYPGNEDLQAYYVKALILTKDYENAYNISLDNLTSNEFKPLLAEALLTYENSISNSDSITEYIKTRNDPAFFEYLSNLLDNDQLMIDSALLWAQHGEIDKAYQLVFPYTDEEYAELLALLAYDSGKKSESLVRLLELPLNDSIKYDNLLIIADLFYLKDNWSRSRFYYEKAIDINRFDSKPYINISSIYLKQDSLKQAISTIEQGIISFKSSLITLTQEIEEGLNNVDSVSHEEKEITQRLINKKNSDLQLLRDEYKDLVLLAHFLYNKIESDNAIKVIEDYRRLFPDDVKIELLEMRENNDRSNPDMFIARLWSLLNKDIDNKEVSEFLIWYLLGIENYNDINLVLERSENRHSDSQWTDYYRGIISGLTGEYNKSINYFDTLSNSSESWEVLYNKGIIEMANLNYSQALTLFNKSIIILNQLDFIDNRDIYISKIKTKIAQVLINLNDTDEAIRILNSAFELDPNNYTSDLLKSIYLNLKESE